MRFAAAVSVFLIVTASAISLPVKRDASVKVFSDDSTAQVTIPTTTTDSTSGDVGGKADVAGAVADIISKVVNLIQGMIDGDIKRRQTFTQQTVARVRQETGLNVIMSNVGYNFQGTFISRTSTSYKAKIGADVSYDVITFKAGTFDLQGDGGFQNWAYIVDGTCTTSGKHISCS